MHICVRQLTIIGSDNGLSLGRRQAILWSNAGILLIGPLGTNFSEILNGIQTFSFKKLHLKTSSAKCRLFCRGLNELSCLRLCGRDSLLAQSTWSNSPIFSSYPAASVRIHVLISPSYKNDIISKVPCNLSEGIMMRGSGEVNNQNNIDNWIFKLVSSPWQMEIFEFRYFPTCVRFDARTSYWTLKPPFWDSEEQYPAK